MWIVATYRKEPADISKRIPTQNMSEFCWEPTRDDSQKKSAKNEMIVAIGADRVKAYFSINECSLLQDA